MKCQNKIYKKICIQIVIMFRKFYFIRKYTFFKKCTFYISMSSISARARARVCVCVCVCVCVESDDECNDDRLDLLGKIFELFKSAICFPNLSL